MLALATVLSRSFTRRGCPLRPRLDVLGRTWDDLAHLVTDHDPRRGKVFSKLIELLGGLCQSVFKPSIHCPDADADLFVAAFALVLIGNQVLFLEVSEVFVKPPNDDYS